MRAAIIKQVALRVSPMAAKMLATFIERSKSVPFMRADEEDYIRLLFALPHKAIQKSLSMKDLDYQYVLGLLEGANLVVRHQIRQQKGIKVFTEINFQQLSTFLPEEEHD